MTPVECLTGEEGDLHIPVLKRYVAPRLSDFWSLPSFPACLTDEKTEKTFRPRKLNEEELRETAEKYGFSSERVRGVAIPERMLTDVSWHKALERAIDLEVAFEDHSLRGLMTLFGVGNVCTAGEDKEARVLAGNLLLGEGYRDTVLHLRAKDQKIGLSSADLALLGMVDKQTLREFAAGPKATKLVVVGGYTFSPQAFVLSTNPNNDNFTDVSEISLEEVKRYKRALLFMVEFPQFFVPA